MAWNDEPPTKQELTNATANWASAPPSADELAKISAKASEKDAESKISMPKAIAVKVLQGGTSGLSDEIQGINTVLDDLQAPGEFSMKELGKRYSWDSIKTSYEKGRDKSREDQNLAKTAYPKTAMASEIAGAVVSPLNKVMPANAIKSGIALGALGGFGNSEADDAGGVVKDTAVGAGVGGAIGYGVEKIAAPIAKWGSNVIDEIKAATNLDGAGSFGNKGAAKGFQQQSANATAEQSAKITSSLESGAMDIEQGGQVFDIKPPKTLDELRAWKPSPESSETVAAKRLGEIEEFAPELKIKPLKYHYDMLHDPKAMKKMKLEFENLPTDDARKTAIYNQEIVNESGREVKNLIQTISKDDAKPLGEAGQDFIQTIKDKYHGEKDALAPAFKDFREKAIDLTKDETFEIAQDIGSKTKIGKLLDVTVADPEKGIEGGKLYLKPFSTKIGVTENDYKVIGKVVDDLNEGASFEEIQKIREYLRNKMDPINPKDTMEISKVRGVLLDSLEKMGGKRDVGFTEIAKKYAINEKSLESLEKIIGKIETLDQTFSANPDQIVQKIFSNPNYVNFVAEYAGQDVVDKMVSSFVTNGIKGSYDAVNGFSPVTLRRWLKTNDKFLNNYVDDVVVKKLHLYADYGYLGSKFLHEVNPSGTAASLIAGLEPKSIYQKIKTQGAKAAVISEFESKVMASVKQKQAAKFMNEAMGAPVPPPKPPMKFPDIKPDIRKADVVGGLVAATNSTNAEQKWADKGSKAIMDQDSEIGQSVVNELRKSKRGLNLLIQASDFKKDSPALKKIIEQIKATDEYKKSKTLTKSDYPKKLLKDGYSAIVKNKMEHDEAKKEGWTNALA